MSKRTRNKRRDADFEYQDDTDDDQTEANALIKESETDMAGQGADVGVTANALITQSTGSVNLEAILSQLAVGVSNLQKTLNGLSLNRERHKLGLVLTCLKGTAADWASIKEKSFDDFETAFVSRFWGVDKQRDLFLKLNYGQFEGGSRFLICLTKRGFCQHHYLIKK